MLILLILLGFVIVAILIRLIAGTIDTERIESYVRNQGWILLDKSWDPFGPGWFGEKDARIYQIVYKDSHGDVHKAHVKTSMFSGVYLTNDQIVEHATREMRVDTRLIDDLRAENERLRKRIRELEEGKNRSDNTLHPAP